MMHPENNQLIAKTVNATYRLPLFAAAALMGLFGCMADPDNPQVMFERGNLRADREQYEDAIPLFTAALEAMPDREDILFERGLCYERIGLDKKALADYDAALKLDPQYSDALNNKGVILARTERFEEAIEVFTEIVNQFPDDPLALRNRGLCRFDLGQFDEAMKDYNLVLDLTPKDVETWFQRGNVYLEQELFDDAIADYSHAIEIDEEFARAWMNRGVAKFGMKDRKGGMADLEQAHLLNENIVIPDLNWGQSDEAKSTTVVAAKPVLDDSATQNWDKCLSAALSHLRQRDLTNIQVDVAIPRMKCARLTATTNANEQSATREIYVAVLSPDSNDIILPPLTSDDTSRSLLVLDATNSEELHVNRFVEDWTKPAAEAAPVAIRMTLDSQTASE